MKRTHNLDKYDVTFICFSDKMKFKYNGNIKRVSDILARVNSSRSVYFFPNNNILQAKIDGNQFIIHGFFCNAKGSISKQEDSLIIDLKVRLKTQFIFVGFFVIILLIGFLLGENVTINGDINPTVWKKFGFVAIGFMLFLIHGLLLMKLRSDFEKKVLEILK